MTTPTPHGVFAYPTVTVGLTSYCSREIVSRAIASALTQDWPSIELLIVDDCSPDDSAAVIEQAIIGAPNARLIRHATNGGPGAARATILAAAKGSLSRFSTMMTRAVPSVCDSNMRRCKRTKRQRECSWWLVMPRGGGVIRMVTS